RPAFDTLLPRRIRAPAVDPRPRAGPQRAPTATHEQPKISALSEPRRRSAPASGSVVLRSRTAAHRAGHPRTPRPHRASLPQRLSSRLWRPEDEHGEAVAFEGVLRG